MNTLKKVFPVAIAALFGSTIGVADISGNLGVTSNYLWRGITQTNDKAAVSGGIDYTNDSGFYMGSWISNVESGNETDFYLGINGASETIEYTLGAIYYHYSQFDDADFAEIHADISINQFSAGVAYTPWGQANDKTSLFVEGDLYYYLSYGFSLQDNWNLSFTVGHYDYENDGIAGDAYTHGQVDLGKSLGKYGDVNLSASKTDLKSYDDPVFSVSWALSF